MPTPDSLDLRSAELAAAGGAVWGVATRAGWSGVRGLSKAPSVSGHPACQRHHDYKLTDPGNKPHPPVLQLWHYNSTSTIVKRRGR